jgi:expansin (peptidoglycan-binding protein)
MMKRGISLFASTILLATTLFSPADAAGPEINGDASFYEVGFGACGKSANNTQLVAAISHLRFDPETTKSTISNKLCGQKVKVINGKKSVIVTIVDRCASCAKDDIALSPAAYKKIASMDSGKVPVQWKLM